MKKNNTSLLLLFFLISTIVASQDSIKTSSGKASFYHNSFHGQETSNGESYNKNDFTAAHRTMPFGTILLVTNKKNNKSTIVRVNDRGPFARSRVIDLSYAAAVKLRMVPFGVIQVRITPLTWLNSSPLNDSAFHDGEIWDCYGKKQVLKEHTLFIWKTENWRHAFYMASSLTIEKKTDIYIAINGKNQNRTYSLLITNLDNSEYEKLKKLFSKEGFRAGKT